MTTYIGQPADQYRFTPPPSARRILPSQSSPAVLPAERANFDSEEAPSLAASRANGSCTSRLRYSTKSEIKLMTTTERKIIAQFASGEITRDELYSLLPWYSDIDCVSRLYEDVITQKDREKLCYLRMLPVYENEQLEEIWKVLLTEDWHSEHEDLIRVFQYIFNRKQENIDFLLKIFRHIPLYISQDSAIKRSYLQNIIYAIGAQPQPESLCALEYLLSETKDEEIKKMISSQIEKRHSIVGGKYEFEKIAK